MWVRSQNREILADINIFVVNNGEIIAACNNSETKPFTIAKYSTEEKAMKVLDKIIERIDIMDEGVYQMPQEDKVK